MEVWTEFAIPLVGIGLFVAVAGARQAPQPTHAGALVVLTVLLGGWLFGEGLVWRKRWPSMIRGGSAWATDPAAWQWVGLLVLAIAAVTLLGLSVRLFASSRPRRAWQAAALALLLFGRWSAVVRYSLVLGVIAAAVTLITLGAGQGLGARPGAWRPARGGRTRVATITATTVVAMVWISLAALWFLLEQGENVTCGCWADHRGAWQYTLELALALAGAMSLGVAVGSWLTRRHTRLAGGALLAVAALGGWVWLYLSALPVG